MRFNYYKLLEINRESSDDHGGALSSFHTIQMCVDRYLSGDTLSTPAINMLIDLGILEYNTEEKRQIVQPFNFTGDGTQNQ